MVSLFHNASLRTENVASNGLVSIIQNYTFPAHKESAFFRVALESSVCCSNLQLRFTTNYNAHLDNHKLILHWGVAYEHPSQWFLAPPFILDQLNATHSVYAHAVQSVFQRHTQCTETKRLKTVSSASHLASGTAAPQDTYNVRRRNLHSTITLPQLQIHPFGTADASVKQRASNLSDWLSSERRNYLQRLELDKHTARLGSPASFTQRYPSSLVPDPNPSPAFESVLYEVVVPLGTCQQYPPYFKFVLYDENAQRWIYPSDVVKLHPELQESLTSHFFSASRAPSFLESLSPLLPGGHPQAARQHSVLLASDHHGLSAPLSAEAVWAYEDNFIFHVQLALRHLVLLKFRSAISLMKPSPQMYSQFDLGAQLNASVDVGVWSAIDAASCQQDPPPTAASHALVEIVTNLDVEKTFGENENLILHWGVFSGEQASTPTRKMMMMNGWEIPNLCSWPSQTCHGTNVNYGRKGAVETVMKKGLSYGTDFELLWCLRVPFPIAQIPHGIAFVMTSSSRKLWIKTVSGQDFSLFFSHELKLGIGKRHLLKSPLSCSLFCMQSCTLGTQNQSNTDSGHETNHSDSVQSVESEPKHLKGSGIDVVAAGAAVALKIAQNPALTGRRRYRHRKLPDGQNGYSSGGGMVISSPVNAAIGSPAQELAQQRVPPKYAQPEGKQAVLRDKLKDSMAPKDLGPAAESAQPWIYFAGKKMLLSSSSFRRTHDINVAEKGHMTVQYGSFHNEKGNVTFLVACECVFPTTLHWGFANMNPRAGGKWKMPSKSFWPPQSVCASEAAVETSLRSSNRKNLWIFELTLPVYVAPKTYSSFASSSSSHKLFGYESMLSETSTLPYSTTVSQASGFKAARLTPLTSLSLVSSAMTSGSADAFDGHLGDASHMVQIADSSFDEDEDHEQEFHDLFHGIGKRQMMLNALVNKARYSTYYQRCISTSSQHYSSIVDKLPIYYDYLMHHYKRMNSSRDMLTSFHYHKTLRAWEKACIAFSYLPQERLDTKPSESAANEEEDCNGIYFVVTDAQHAFWVKENDHDFYIPSRRMKYGPSLCLVWRGPQRRLVETIFTAELTYSTWGFRERYHLLKSILQDETYHKTDLHFWSWVCVWFAFFTPKYYHLCPAFLTKSLVDRSIGLHHFPGIRFPLVAPLNDVQGTTLQPWNMATQIDKLVLLLTSYWRNCYQRRPLLRMVLSKIMFPKIASKLYTKMKSIFTNWNLTTQPFFRSWLEKVHITCTPEDLVICRAVMLFFRTQALSDFQDVLEFHGIDLGLLCDQQPIWGRPIMTFLTPEEMPPGFETKPSVLMEVDIKTGTRLRPWRKAFRAPCADKLRWTAPTGRPTLLSSQPSKYQQADDKLAETAKSKANEGEPSGLAFSASQWIAIAIKGTNREAISSTDLVQQEAKPASPPPPNDPCEDTPPVSKESLHQDDFLQGMYKTSNPSKPPFNPPSNKTLHGSNESANNRQDKHPCIEDDLESGGSNMTLHRRTEFNSHQGQSCYESIEEISTVSASLTAHTGAYVSQAPRLGAWTHTDNEDNLHDCQTLWVKEGDLPSLSTNDPIWVVQFYAKVYLSELMRDLRLIESMLECLFEGMSFEAAAYATRKSWNGELRDVINAILFTDNVHTDCTYYNVCHARHCLFAVIEHCTDNSVLRDAMYLDLALETLQNEIALRFLHQLSFQDSCGALLYRDVVRISPQLDDGEEHQDILIAEQEDSDDENSSLGSVSATCPRPESSSSTSLINPIYVLKDLFCCAVSSLLAFHAEFTTMDCLHADIASLLADPVKSNDTEHYGFALQTSLIHLREATCINASVEQTQFARGFLQTQGQRKCTRRTYQISVSHLLRQAVTSFNSFQS